jgi:ParB-like chromosome segregation protein Spo0J
MTDGLTILTIKADDLRPNPWNPNRMDADMYAKERASIREFGFIDPLTVRPHEDHYQIIDGEHRWRAGIDEGVASFPAIVLDVDDDEARELTIVLNDTRGVMQEDRLAALVRDLATRRDQARLERILPYERSRLDSLMDRREIDWSELEKRREQAKEEGAERWVERIYRMPVAAAEVVDRAVRQVREDEEIEQDWRALEFIAADFLS